MGVPWDKRDWEKMRDLPVPSSWVLMIQFLWFNIYKNIFKVSIFIDAIPKFSLSDMTVDVDFIIKKSWEDKTRDDGPLIFYFINVV